jgi:dUTPase
MVIRKVELTEFETVEELSATSRGDGGFGSTNK